MVVAYSGMGVTFFYCLYLFIVFDFKKIKNFYKKTKDSLYEKSKFVSLFSSDKYFRTMVSTMFSLMMSLCFVIYNAVVGLVYHSVWNGSISVYYGFLVAIRVLFLVGEYKISIKDNFSKGEKDLRRAKMLKLEGILLLLLNLALVVPVSLLAMSKKQVNLPMWVAIANATYTFYKITICIISFIKTRNDLNLSVKGIKNLSLTSAGVSLLSLENTMIITFSETVDNSMQIIMILSALAIMILNIVVAVITLKNGKKEIKKLKNDLSWEQNESA